MHLPHKVTGDQYMVLVSLSSIVPKQLAKDHFILLNEVVQKVQVFHYLLASYLL